MRVSICLSDDILVVSASFENHLRDVGLVLDRLKEAHTQQVFVCQERGCVPWIHSVIRGSDP